MNDSHNEFIGMGHALVSCTAAPAGAPARTAGTSCLHLVFIHLTYWILLAYVDVVTTMAHERYVILLQHNYGVID